MNSIIGSQQPDYNFQYFVNGRGGFDLIYGSNLSDYILVDGIQSGWGDFTSYGSGNLTGAYGYDGNDVFAYYAENEWQNWIAPSTGIDGGVGKDTIAISGETIYSGKIWDISNISFSNIEYLNLLWDAWPQNNLIVNMTSSQYDQFEKIFVTQYDNYSPEHKIVSADNLTIYVNGQEIFDRSKIQNGNWSAIDYDKNSPFIYVTPSVTSLSNDLIILPKTTLDAQITADNDWYKYTIGVGYSAGIDLAKDNNGNVYSAGYLFNNNIISFGYDNVINQQGYEPQITNFSNQITGVFKNGYSGSGGNYINSQGVKGENDAYVAKVDATGKMQWLKYFGGDSYEAAISIASDVNGDVIFGGYTYSQSYSSNRTSDGYLIDPLSSFGGETDGFLSKIDENGNTIWDRRFGSYGYDVINSVVTLSDGSILVGGSVVGSLNISSKSGIIYSSSNSFMQGDYFVTRLSANGDVIWSQQWGDINNQGITSLAVYNDKLWALGTNNNSSYKGFSSVFNIDLNSGLLWQGSNIDLGYTSNDGPWPKIVIDQSGHLYAAGNYSIEGSVSLGSAFVKAYDISNGFYDGNLLFANNNVGELFDVKIHDLTLSGPHVGVIVVGTIDKDGANELFYRGVNSATGELVNQDDISRGTPGYDRALSILTYNDNFQAVSGYERGTQDYGNGFLAVHGNLQTVAVNSAPKFFTKLTSDNIVDPTTQFYWDPAVGGNGHIYEFVKSNAQWAVAKELASQRGIYGNAGYLSTITSEAEYAFIINKTSSNNVWIGGSDGGGEGSWIWVNGPEQGQNIVFAPWAQGEPNNNFDVQGTSENYLMVWGVKPGIDYGAYFQTGQWNDIANEGPNGHPYGSIDGFVVEYGDNGFTGSFDISEYTSSGAFVGNVTASDAEGDGLTYSLTGGNLDFDGDGELAFRIDAATGNIFVNDSGDLRLEWVSNYSLEVTAFDGELSATTSVDVNLTPIERRLIVFNPNAEGNWSNEHHFEVPENSPVTDFFIDGSDWWVGNVQIQAYWGVDYSQILNITDSESASYRAINTLQLFGQFSEINIDLQNTNIDYLIDGTGWPESAVYNISVGINAHINNINLNQGNDRIIIDGYDREYANVNGTDYFNWVNNINLSAGNNYLEISNTDIGYINSEKGNDTIIIYNAVALLDENGDPISGYDEEGGAINSLEWGTSTDIIDLGRGENYVEIHNGGVEVITSRRGDDTIKLFNAYADVINFKSGDNHLYLENDLYNFNTGVGTVQGYSGDDTVSGHGRIENLNLGGGNNRVDFSGGWIGYLNTNAGNDEIYLANTNVMALAVEGGNNLISITNDESRTDGWVGSIQAFSGNDVINIFNTGVDQISVGNGDNEIRFEKRWVGSIQAFDGNDKINVVDAHIDQINAGGGNNIIEITSGWVGSITTYGQNDIISTGDAEVDQINAGSGDNRIITGSGYVGTIQTYGGNDYIEIGSGWGKFVSTGGGSDYIKILQQRDTWNGLIVDGGYDSGTDIVDLSEWSLGITIQLGNGIVWQSPASVNGDGYASEGLGWLVLLGIEGIRGTDFNDVIYGSDIGSTANNILFGGDGNDKLYGLAGADQLNGGRGNDLLDGGIGNDTADYSDRTDDFVITLYANGDGRASTITQESEPTQESDTLKSIENIWTGSGNDTVLGNRFDNSFQLGMGEDSLDGGLGNDTVDYSYEDRKIVAVINGAAWSSVRIYNLDNNLSETDRIKSIENFVGGHANDVITGDNLANRIDGGLGDDIIDGGRGSIGGVDRLIGNLGNDILISGRSDDTLDGGGGIDTASYQNAYSAVTISLSINEQQNTGGAGIDQLIDIENVLGSKFGDMIYGNDFANKISGNDGNDFLYGLNGNDTLIGSAGDDLLDGGEGSDTVSYEDVTIYRDLMSGGKLGVFVDLNLLGPQFNLGSGLDTLVSIENVTGSQYDDRIFGNGDINIIAGGLGDDVIAGFDGDDILIGGLGHDTLSGGNGDDQFILDIDPSSLEGNQDWIIDFEAGRDNIKLLSSAFLNLSVNPYLHEHLSEENFFAGDNAQAQTQHQKIIYDTSNGTLYFDQDGSDTGHNQIEIAKIGQSGHPILSAFDIIIG